MTPEPDPVWGVQEGQPEDPRWREYEVTQTILIPMLQQPRGPRNALPTQVAVHSSDPVSRLGAISMLTGEAQLRVLDDADRGRAGVTVVVEKAVGDSAIAWLRGIRGEAGSGPAPYCVLVADNIHTLSVLTVVECGIAAVLPRDELDGGRLVRTVLSVSRGDAYLPPTIQGALLTQLNRVQREVLEPNGLTMFGMATRERDILRLLADGLGTEEIATELAYSERTVKNVLRDLMSRYRLNTRAHAVAFAMRAGIV
jgi:DNA-binding NarL/FixJ family response regulator